MKALSKALSAAIIAGGAVVTVQAFGTQCPCAISNVDYYGHDVDKFFSGPQTACVDACQKACQNNKYCHYFTYVTDRRECYLKDADASREPRFHPTAISGPKFCGAPPLAPGKPPQYPHPRPPIYIPHSTEHIPVPVPQLPLPPPQLPLPPPQLPVPPRHIPVPPLPGKPTPPTEIPLPPTKPHFDIHTLCFKDNIDYFGFDLKKFECGVAPTPLACQQLCVQEKECRYWTFTRHDKVCYLKTRGATAGARTNTNAISGPRECDMVPQMCFEKDVDYYGCDIQRIEGHTVVSPMECQKHCQMNPGCRYWTWVSAQRNCYLKSENAIKNRRFSPGNYSGPRICDGSNAPGGMPQCLEYNVEYVHGTYRTCEARNLKACQALCLADPQCEYLTFKLDVLECALKSKFAVGNKAYRKFTYSTSKQCNLNQYPGKYPFPPLFLPHVDGKPVPPPPAFPPFRDGRSVPEVSRLYPHIHDFQILPPYPPFLDGAPVPEQPPYLDGMPIPEPPRFPPYTDGNSVPMPPQFPPHNPGNPQLPVPVPIPPKGCIELNTDYTGNTIGSTTCHSVATCQRVCQLTFGCHYFSFVDDLKLCNLKGDKGTARPCPGTISGPATCTPQGPPAPDVCYHYAVIVGDPIGADVAYSAPVCQNLCTNKPGCAYFTYSLNDGECLYFKNKHYQIPSPFSISGLRVCSGGPVDHDWGYSTISPPNVSPPAMLPVPSKPPHSQRPSRGCVHTDVDFTGHNIGITPATCFEECRRACEDDPECHCFTYVETTGQCYLKSETGLVTPKRGCISGLKDCH